MNRSKRRKYRDIRIRFKKDLYKLCKTDKTLIFLLRMIYVSGRDNIYINKTHKLISGYPELLDQHFKNIMMKTRITGNRKISLFLHYLYPKLEDKYIHIPENLMLGDLYAVFQKAYKNNLL